MVSKDERRSCANSFRDMCAPFDQENSLSSPCQSRRKWGATGTTPSTLTLNLTLNCLESPRSLDGYSELFSVHQQSNTFDLRCTFFPYIRKIPFARHIHIRLSYWRALTLPASGILWPITKLPHGSKRIQVLPFDLTYCAFWARPSEH